LLTKIYHKTCKLTIDWCLQLGFQRWFVHLQLCAYTLGNANPECSNPGLRVWRPQNPGTRVPPGFGGRVPGGRTVVRPTSLL